MTPQGLQSMELEDGAYVYGHAADLWRAGYEELDQEVECLVRIPVDMLEGGTVSVHSVLKQMFKPEFVQCVIDEWPTEVAYAKAKP